MDIAIILAKIYGAMLLVVGLSALNKTSMTAMIEGLEKEGGLLWVTGFVTFLIGATSLALYSDWSGGWRILITIFGWLTLLKGIGLTVFPNLTMSLYKIIKIENLVFYSGVTAVILGIGVLYLAFN